MRWRQVLVALVGLAIVTIGIVLGFDSQSAWSWSAGVAFGVVVIVLVALVLGPWKIRGALDAATDAPAVPWASDDSFANPAPERSDRNPPLSSDALAAVIEEAGVTARRSGTVADGLAVVRPALREALLEALEQGGRSRRDAEAALATGAWTDDRVAASVLEESVRPPARSLRERVRAWLFPERIVRRRSQRAMGAVAEAGEEALPTVPGQTAPRTVPVLRPRLEDLERGADGRLQRAVDPTATARGPRPPQPRLATDEDGNGTDGSDTDGHETDGAADTEIGTGDSSERGNERREVTDR